MILDLDSIPFFLDKDATDDDYSLFGGEFSSGSSGVMRFEDNALVLEFVTAIIEYSITSVKQSRTDVQTRVIPLHLIQSIECKRWKFRNNTGAWKHVWNPKMIITTKSLKALEGIPSARGHELMLTLEVRGFQASRAFAAQVTALLADERLRHIEAGQQKHLPPSV
ncbi:MAG: hypothetical protein JNN25_09470 [Candidatus Kapabacteria bacterium]|nr:hypothetical protein [Candidatus Kapabacteria bacterium]